MVSKAILRLMAPFRMILLRSSLSVLVVFFSLLIFLFSCEKDITKGGDRSDANFPSQVIYNADIIRRDSGKIQGRFNAPIVEKYEFVDTPYVEMNKGIYFEFYDGKTSDTLRKFWANYAKIIEKKDFYQAKGDVKMISIDGQKFETQSIYWDRKNKKIYTRDTIYVTDSEGSTFVSSGGMDAKDDLSEYNLYNNTGNKVIPRENSKKK